MSFRYNPGNSGHLYLTCLFFAALPRTCSCNTEKCDKAAAEELKGKTVQPEPTEPTGTTGPKSGSSAVPLITFAPAFVIVLSKQILLHNLR